MRVFVSLLIILLVSCARVPDWEKQGIVKATLIENPLGIPNPFMELADDIEKLESGIPRENRFQVSRERLLNSAESVREELAPKWDEFLTELEDGESLYRCELLEDEFYAIYDGPKVLSRIWIKGSNSGDRMGLIEYEK